MDQLKGVNGTEGPNTITTEITSGPCTRSGKSDGDGNKARKLLGLFRRESMEEQKKRSVDEDDTALNEVSDAPLRPGPSKAPAPNGITVQYDIRRTVEDAHGCESSSRDDCITCIEEESLHQEDV